MIFDLLNFELGRFRSRKKVFEKNFFLVWKAKLVERGACLCQAH